MIGYVSILRLVLVALIVVPLLSVLPAPEARAAATSYWCGDTIYDEQRYVGDPNCKYALAKAGYDPRDGGATFVDSLWIRGGTASKTCDPSNNVHQWAIDTDHGSGGSGPASAFLYTAPEGYVFWSRGRISYKDNCDSNSSAALSIFQVDKYTTYEPLYFRLEYWHKLSSGSGFETVVIVRGDGVMANGGRKDHGRLPWISVLVPVVLLAGLLAYGAVDSAEGQRDSDNAVALQMPTDSQLKWALRV